MVKGIEMTESEWKQYEARQREDNKQIMDAEAALRQFRRRQVDSAALAVTPGENTMPTLQTTGADTGSANALE